MSSKHKIAILCNNRIAIPAIQALYSQELLFGIGIPEENTEIKEILEKIFTNKNIFILKKHTFEQDLKKISQDKTIKYFFTMTFPWKISENILKDNPDRFYNFHYGLLPEMRGAHLIFKAIRQQFPTSGITVHAIEKQVDSGAIILRKEIPQDASKTKYFKRPDITTASIDWNSQDAHAIDALIRACNPWNKGAYTRWNQWIFRIVEATVTEILQINHIQQDLSSKWMKIQEFWFNAITIPHLIFNLFIPMKLDLDLVKN